MNKIYHRKLSKAALLVLGFACAIFTGWAQEAEEEVFVARRKVTKMQNKVTEKKNLLSKILSAI